MNLSIAYTWNYSYKYGFKTKKQNTILIVDDVFWNIVVLKYFLSKDYNILTAESGYETINLIKKNIIPDIILLDIIIPNMDKRLIE